MTLLKTNTLRSVNKTGRDGKPLNFLFDQNALFNRKKWAGRQDFWASLRRNGTPVAPKWDAFEKWRQGVKDANDK